VRALVGIQIIGCDIVEISPDHDPSGNTALLAASVLTELLATIARTRST
jgi:arginase family enzyme